MKNLLNMLTATSLAVGFAAPVFAQTAMVDPMTMTCADFSAMDADAMMGATQTMDMAMAMTDEEMTAAMAMTDEEKMAMQTEMETAMAAMTDEEKATAMATTETSMAAMVAACGAMPDGTVMDAMKATM